MKFSFKCPACGKEMGIFRLFMTLTPFIFTCVRCFSTLRVKNIKKYIISKFIISAIIIISYTLYYVSINGYVDAKVLIFAFVIFLINEFTSALIICNKGNVIAQTNRYKSKKQND